MDFPNYYVDVDGGYLDASLPDVRKVAIGYLMDHQDMESINVYTSPTMKRIVGTVELSKAYPMYRWRSSRGSSATLDRSGKIVRFI